jgi:hypothetical protein
LATKFDAEIEFVTKLNKDGSLNDIVVNAYRAHSDQSQGVGLDRRGEVFRFGDEVKTIKKHENSDDIYTAITAVGKDGLTIQNVEHEVFDDNGNLLYCTYKSGTLDFPTHVKFTHHNHGKILGRPYQKMMVGLSMVLRTWSIQALRLFTDTCYRS